MRSALRAVAVKRESVSGPRCATMRVAPSPVWRAGASGAPGPPAPSPAQAGGGRLGGDPALGRVPARGEVRREQSAGPGVQNYGVG